MNARDTILQLTTAVDLSTVQSPQWYSRLREAVNDMVVHDFSGLVQLLYRMDVEEHLLRKALADNTGIDAADILARLMVERQVKKIEMRRHFSAGQPPGEREW